MSRRKRLGRVRGNALEAWNEFIIAYVFLHDSDKQTLTVWLASFTNLRGTECGPLMAGATLTALPVLTFFVLVQKRIAFELTAGVVKGWCFDGRDPLQQRDEGARAVLELPSVRPELEGYVGRCIAVGIRPENVRDASLAPDGALLQGCTLLVEELGAELLAHVEVSATPLGKIDLVDAASVPSDGVEVADTLGHAARQVPA